MKFNEKNCVGCGVCVRMCPFNAREMFDDLENGIRKLKFYPERCRRCGLCKEVCINSAINEEGGVDEIKKELVFCDKCGAVLTTRAHLFYIINKLKEKYYANQTLRRISAENMGIETRDLKLCPLCLMEEYKKVRAI